MCHGSKRLVQRRAERCDKTGCLCPCCPQRSALTEHRAQGEFVAVDAAGQAQPGRARTRPPITSSWRSASAMASGSASRSSKRRQRATALARSRRSSSRSTQRTARGSGSARRSRCRGRGSALADSFRRGVFQTGNGAHFEEAQQGGPVEGLPAAQAKLDDSRRAEAGTLRPVTHLARGRGENVSDGVVELADARNPAAKAASRPRAWWSTRSGAGQRWRAGRAPVRPGLRQPARTRVAKMAIAEAQSLGEPEDAFAVDNAVSDQAHGTRTRSGAPVPLGRPGPRRGGSACRRGSRPPARRPPSGKSERSRVSLAAGQLGRQ